LALLSRKSKVVHIEVGVFENRVLRRIFGPKRDEVTGGWIKLHDEELNVLYSSPNIVWVIKSRRIRWAGNVVCMGRVQVYTGFWWGNLRERDHLEDPGEDESSGNGLGAWIGTIWLRVGTGGGHL